MTDGRRGGTVIGLRKASTSELIPLSSGPQSWVVGSDASCDVRVHNDPFVSGKHCVLERYADGMVIVRDNKSRNGTYVDGNHVEGAELRVGSYLTVGRTTLVAVSDATARGGGNGAGAYAVERPAIELLRGKDAVLRMTVDQALRAAQTDCSVLIGGETGTGKDLIARLVHESSRRMKGPFVAVNCGAIPRELIASELFGHEKGAFTGATEGRDGYFFEAKGGTLFLDEIGELPIELQPTLLRVLETRRVRRVGGTTERHVDVRIVAATNRLDAIGDEASGLRRDLYHRLATLTLVLPPLRERMGDLVELVEAMLEELAGDFGEKEVSEEAWLALATYSWPGNIRELRHAVARAVTLGSRELTAADFFPHLNGRPRRLTLQVPSVEEAREDRGAGTLVPYQAMLKTAMEQALHEHGSIRAAAMSLGMPKSTFADRAREWQLLGRRKRRA
ncbi:MAG TPA: sigma 54-interacting transcriptional regulator [Kofleriaceae bacterium]|nr:sigma 54-interacting transcriptional regulator [Kofleriaceae bacterium]